MLKNFGRKYFTGKFAGFFAIIGNTLLFVIKLWAGIVSGSVALVADAWHTISDSLSSVVFLFGIYISSKPADENHPYGHGRAEIIASLVIGLILVLIAINFLYGSVIKIINKETVNYGYFAIAATIISLVGKEIMARVSFYAAKKEKLKSLEADGLHHRSDALTSGVILIGIILERYIWWIDGALGVFVSCMILYLAYRIVNESISPLLGENPDREMIEKIIAISREIHNNDLYLHHFQMHRYGHHTELTFHIKLPGDFNLDEANQITAKFIKKIKSELNIFATIYIDSYTKTDQN